MIGIDKKKVFPIKQGVACQLKWTWNTVRLLESTSACCHRVSPISLTPETFQNFHNHPTWIDHRNMQLEGKFPQQGCHVCEKVEKSGGMSDRLLHLSEVDIYPPELDVDPLAVNVTPRILEVFLNNACNLACIYCDESNSSRIQKENKKFGYAVPGVEYSAVDDSKNIIRYVIPNNRYQEMLSQFFTYLGNNSDNLRRLNILGGEPFYQKEFHTLINFITERNNPNLILTVFSNLMASRPVLENFVDKMKHSLASRRLRRVVITASIDCFGPEQAYVRYGIELDQWMSNFEYLLSHKWLYVNINNTITSLTIKTLPELLKYINEHRKYRSINHAFSLVDGRPHLHPEIFGSGFFDDDFEKTILLMPETSQWELNLKSHMKGIQQSLKAGESDYKLQKQLKLYLDEIDRRRSVSWPNTFPWLYKHFKGNINVV